MRSFFNRPSWASRGNEDGNPEFYRRAGQTYKDIVATNISARSQQAKSAQSSSHKRRRLSSESEDGQTQESTGEQCVPTAAGATSPVGDSPLPQDVSHVKTPLKSQDSISRASTAVDEKGSLLPTPQDSPDSEPPSMRTSSTPSYLDTRSHEKEDHIASSSEDKEAPSQTGTCRHGPNAAYNNTVVQILITSNIADTKPLIVHRKMAQSLRGVRIAWCAHQKFPKERHSTIFLTWKGRRLFDVTTCRSLNIDVDNAFTKELSPFNNCFEDTDECRIHMEAVTEEIFAAGHRSPPDMGGFSSTTSALPQESPEAAEHPRSEIMLKCPRYGDFKTRVPLTTSVSHVVEAYREAKNIPAELAVYLGFDGDRLDSQSCLADHEIADGDLVDVLVKTTM